MKIGLLVLLTLLVACSTQQVPSSGGITGAPAVITALEGNVTVNGDPAREKMPLNVGDRIMTGADSEVTIVLYDSSRLQLWDDTTLVIRALDDNPRAVDIEQTSGEIWGRVLHASRLSRLRVTTPDAVATVRGTGFWVAYRNGTTGVGVTDGIVAVQHVEHGNVLRERLVQKEEQVFVDGPMTVEPLVHDEFIDENLENDKEFIAAVREKFGDET